MRELPTEKLIFAEDSTAYPQITHSKADGGLGFSFKWNMGWMNDMLSYMEMDSFFRKWNHNKLTFSLCYAFSEAFVLPLSHDEVVHGKRSLLSKMPGDYWQKFAQLRLLYACQYAHPGKKLLFMGGEFGQFIEWNFAESLDWLLLDYDKHRELQRMVRDLNRFYAAEPSLYREDDSWKGFKWLAVDDSVHSIAAWLRLDGRGGALLCAFNFTPVPWQEYRVGVPAAGVYSEVFSTDDARYGGTGEYANPMAETIGEPLGGFAQQLSLRLPPYGAVYLRYQGEFPDGGEDDGAAE